MLLPDSYTFGKSISCHRHNPYFCFRWNRPVKAISYSQSLLASVLRLVVFEAVNQAILLRRGRCQRPSLAPKLLPSFTLTSSILLLRTRSKESWFFTLWNHGSFLKICLRSAHPFVASLHAEEIRRLCHITIFWMQDEHFVAVNCSSTNMSDKQQRPPSNISNSNMAQMGPPNRAPSCTPNENKVNNTKGNVI